jgi:biopolymer transport protein TolR
VDEMLATWRKPAGLIRSTQLSTLAPMMALLAAIAVMSGMIVPQPYHGVSTDLPKIMWPISLPHSMREDAMIVTIMRNGDVFFRNDRVSPDRLAEAIRVQVLRGSERKVYIRADARALYRSVKQVLDAIQEAGLMNVSFLVDRRR